MAKITTLRTILPLTSAKQYHLHQLDIENAFLHGTLGREAYMCLPSSFPSTRANQVCHLQKSLYDLRQASWQWFATLSYALKSIGYSQSSTDHTLFLKSTESSYTALLVYVDDAVLIGNSLEEYKVSSSPFTLRFGSRTLVNSNIS